MRAKIGDSPTKCSPIGHRQTGGVHDVVRCPTDPDASSHDKNLPRDLFTNRRGELLGIARVGEPVKSRLL